MTNSAIDYYEKLTANYERLVTVMEESRNFAYDTIGSLKDEIDIAKKCRPLIYAVEDAKGCKMDKKTFLQMNDSLYEVFSKLSFIRDFM